MSRRSKRKTADEDEDMEDVLEEREYLPCTCGDEKSDVIMNLACHCCENKYAMHQKCLLHFDSKVNPQHTFCCANCQVMECVCGKKHNGSETQLRRFFCNAYKTDASIQPHWSFVMTKCFGEDSNVKDYNKDTWICHKCDPEAHRQLTADEKTGAEALSSLGESKDPPKETDEEKKPEEANAEESDKKESSSSLEESSQDKKKRNKPRKLPLSTDIGQKFDKSAFEVLFARNVINNKENSTQDEGRFRLVEQKLIQEIIRNQESRCLDYYCTISLFEDLMEENDYSVLTKETNPAQVLLFMLSQIKGLMKICMESFEKHFIKPNFKLPKEKDDSTESEEDSTSGDEDGDIEENPSHASAWKELVRIIFCHDDDDLFLNSPECALSVRDVGSLDYRRHPTDTMVSFLSQFINAYSVYMDFKPQVAIAMDPESWTKSSSSLLYCFPIHAAQLVHPLQKCSHAKFNESEMSRYKDGKERLYSFFEYQEDGEEINDYDERLGKFLGNFDYRKYVKQPDYPNSLVYFYKNLTKPIFNDYRFNQKMDEETMNKVLEAMKVWYLSRNDSVSIVMQGDNRPPKWCIFPLKLPGNCVWTYIVVRYHEQEADEESLSFSIRSVDAFHHGEYPLLSETRMWLSKYMGIHFNMSPSPMKPEIVNEIFSGERMNADGFSLKEEESSKLPLVEHGLLQNSEKFLRKDDYQEYPKRPKTENSAFLMLGSMINCLRKNKVGMEACSPIDDLVALRASAINFILDLMKMFRTRDKKTQLKCFVEQKPLWHSLQLTDSQISELKLIKSFNIKTQKHKTLLKAIIKDNAGNLGIDLFKVSNELKGIPPKRPNPYESSINDPNIDPEVKKMKYPPMILEMDGYGMEHDLIDIRKNEHLLPPSHRSVRKDKEFENWKKNQNLEEKETRCRVTDRYRNFKNDPYDSMITSGKFDEVKGFESRSGTLLEQCINVLTSQLRYNLEGGDVRYLKKEILNHNTLYVTQDDNRVAAVMVFDDNSYAFGDDKVVAIKHMATHPDCVGKGYAKGLVNFLTKFIESQGRPIYVVSFSIFNSEKLVAPKPQQGKRLLSDMEIKKRGENISRSFWERMGFQGPDKYPGMKYIENSLIKMDGTETMVTTLKKLKLKIPAKYEWPKILLLDPYAISKIKFQYKRDQSKNAIEGAELMMRNEVAGVWRRMRPSDKLVGVTKKDIDLARTLLKRGKRKVEVTLSPGHRDNGAVRDPSRIVGDAFPEEFCGFSSDSGDCMWLSAVLAIAQQDEDAASALATLLQMDPTKYSWLQMFKCQEGKRGTSLADLLNFSSNYMLRKVKKYYHMENKDEMLHTKDRMNYLINVRKGMFVMVLKDNNGGIGHAVGLNANMDPPRILDCREGCGLKVSRENFDHCCGENHCCVEIYELAEIIYKRGKGK